MSNNDKNETESPDIIEEIIPGKNNDYNDKSIDQNNINNQQSFIENYDEDEAAHAVIKVSEESKKTIERNTDEVRNQIPRYTHAINDTQKQTAQATKALAENYLEIQKQAINSFQSIFIPYFENVQNQLWSNQHVFRSMQEMYSTLVSNYTESVLAFSKLWNDIAFSNAGLFRSATNKADD
jgi:hypothetical protein